MGGSAVNQCCVVSRGAEAMSPNGSLGRAGGSSCPIRGKPPGRFKGACDGHADAVQYRLARDLERLLRNVRKAGIDDEIHDTSSVYRSNLLRICHQLLPEARSDNFCRLFLSIQRYAFGSYWMQSLNLRTLVASAPGTLGLRRSS